MTEYTVTIKPARIDLGDGDSLNLYRMNDDLTVVRFHGNNPNVQLSSAGVPTSALRAALDQVAPAVPDTRTDEDDTIEALRGVIKHAEEDCRKYRRELDGARARAEKAEAERDEALAAVAETEGRVTAAREDAANAREEVKSADQHILVEQARADRAEKERDQYRADVLNEERISDGYAVRAEKAHATIKEQAALIDALRTEQPRLTPDAIESVLHDILPLTTEHLGADDIANIAFDLHTALTEPPRPEGAEDIETDLRPLDLGGVATPGQVADHLASMGYRKSRAVGRDAR